MNATILCLEATSIEEEIQLLLDKDVVVTIGNIDTAKKVNEIAKNMNKKAYVHLKIDTGFSRYGFLYTEKNEILNSIQSCTSILVDGIFSHFSSAYFEKEDYTQCPPKTIKYKTYDEIPEEYKNCSSLNDIYEIVQE